MEILRRMGGINLKELVSVANGGLIMLTEIFTLEKVSCSVETLIRATLVLLQEVLFTLFGKIKVPTLLVTLCQTLNS